MLNARTLYPVLAVLIIIAAFWFGGGNLSGGVTIAVIGPLTGPAAQYGLSQKNGAKLAFDQINRTGGIGGKRLNVLFLDDANNKILAAEIARDAIYKNGVVAIIGAINSDNTMNLQRIGEKAQVPVLTAVSTNPFITRVNFRYSFRCLSDDNVQAQELAKFSVNTRRLRRVAVIHDGNKYGSEGARTYRRHAGQMGQTITAMENFTTDSTNFRPQLLRIKQTNPDGLLVWGLFRESALVCRQARELGLNVPIFGGDGMAISSFLDIAGSSSEGVFLTYPFHPPRGGPVAMKFLGDYKAAYGSDADSFAAHGYDAMMLMARAIGTSDGTGPGIRAALSGIRQYDGVTGRGGLDEFGNETRPVQLAQVKNGQFVPVEGGNL